MEDQTLHYEFDPDHSRMPKDMKYNDRLQMLATGGADGRINLFRLINGSMTRIATAKDFNAPVSCLEWEPLGYRIACCGYDGQAIIYKVIKEDMIMEYRRQCIQALTSLSWCQLVNYSLVAFSGTSKDIIFVYRQLNYWNCYDITSGLKSPEYNGIPSFVSWSPPSEEKSYLLYGYFDTLIIWEYIRKNKPTFNEMCRVKVELSRDNPYNCIRDVSWYPTIGQNILNPIVLLADRVIFYQDIKMSRQNSQTIELTKGSDNFTLKMGWSDSGTRLNINCLEDKTLTTRTLKCSFDGVWKMTAY